MMLHWWSNLLHKVMYSAQIQWKIDQSLGSRSLHLQVETQANIKFYAPILCAKTRVAPEHWWDTQYKEWNPFLLYCQLDSLYCCSTCIRIRAPIRYADSKVILCWIQGNDKEWKQNRINEIRILIPILKTGDDVPEFITHPIYRREQLSLWNCNKSVIGGSMVLQDMRGIDELGQWRCGSKLVNTEILHSAKHSV